ncbi:MAG: nicotinate-nucleotide adenylyltransferase [Nevskiales bacterium]
MALAPPIGVLGGTFDPIHYGHLRLALEVREALDLSEVRLVPNRAPPHRDAPRMDGARRAAWIRTAIAQTPGLVLDTCELEREEPSYMIDTLRALHAALPDSPLCLILGMDAFAGLLQWREPEKIVQLAHLVLVPRPDTQVALGLQLSNWLAERSVRDPARLRAALGGLIYECAITPLAIAARQIRGLAAAGRNARYLLPDAVWAEIEQEGLYQ